MKGEFYAAIAQIASERSLAKDVILESVEAALISAYKRMTGSDQSVTVRIDPASGQAHVFAHACEHGLFLLLANRRKLGREHEAGNVRQAARTGKQVLCRLAHDLADPIRVPRGLTVEAALDFL